MNSKVIEINDMVRFTDSESGTMIGRVEAIMPPDSLSVRVYSSEGHQRFVIHRRSVIRNITKGTNITWKS